MTELKCKVCGGVIARKGNYYVCEYCRNRWEIDAADDVHAVDRANAWSALRDGDFEKATALFEEILLKDKDGHEAHWGRALATNGILYVTDLSENKKVPTCNNITEDSFINNKDVKAAISLAPEDIAESYKTQAEYIDGVRKEWLEKASKEPEYDVFISFKDSDRDNGIERTQDSIDAQDLYNALVNEGYKVFFSRISLRDKIAEQYEPYIYNAIKTAKVMIVFGEKAEYFSSVWIKNEWSRFKTRIEKGEKHKNSLVVVYKNMNPGDLPAVLSSRQCLNASDIMYFTDLNRHIKKVVELAKRSVHLDSIEIEGGQMPEKATELTVNPVKPIDIGVGAIAETDISEKSQVSLINTYLKAADWGTADKLIEEVLFNNPACAEAIWCKILKNNKAGDEQAFAHQMSLKNARFDDLELLEKLLKCSSKDFAVHILDLFYSVKIASDDLHRDVLECILPFNYEQRPDRIKEVFDNVISMGHFNAFELLLRTLKSNEVDRYISYNLGFVKSTGDTEIKKKLLANVLAVDKGNLEALRTVIDIDITTQPDVEKTKNDLESLLKYTDNGPREVSRIMDILAGDKCTSETPVIMFTKQLLRYYSGNLLDLKAKLLKFADKLMGNRKLSEAEYFYNLVLSVDKNCANSYWGICLIKIGVRCDSEVVNADIPIKNCPEFNKYLSLVDESRRIACIELSRAQEENAAKRIDKAKGKIKVLVNGIKNNNADIDDFRRDKIRKHNEKITLRKGVRTVKYLWPLGILLVLAFVFFIKQLLTDAEFFEGIIDTDNIKSILSLLIISGIACIALSIRAVCKLIDEVSDWRTSEKKQKGVIFTLGIYGFVYAMSSIHEAKKAHKNAVESYDKKIYKREEAIGEKKREIENIISQVNKEEFLTDADKKFICKQEQTVAEETVRLEHGRVSEAETFKGIKKKKRIKFIVKAVCLIAVLAAAFLYFILPKIQNGGVVYKENEYGTKYTVVGVNKLFLGEEIVIKDEYKGKPVTVIDDQAFKGCSKVVSVTVPDSVEVIGAGAFNGCDSLTSITLPFVGQTKNGKENTYFGFIFGLDSYQDFSNGVPSELKTVVITGGSEIKKEAFRGCGSITRIVLPESIETIGEGAFAFCTGLTEMVIPNGVTDIGNLAFNGCSGLKSVTLGSGVKTIGQNAFLDCTGLKSMDIGDSVDLIGASAFKGCTSFESITVPFIGQYRAGTSNTHFGYIFGASSSSYNDDYVPSSLKTVIVTGGASIASSAFEGCNKLTSITIPNTVISIGEYAFANCDSLPSITIPNSVTSFGKGAFCSCDSLVSMVIPDSIATISKDAFNNCENLTSVTIPSSVTEIGENAFLSCDKLAEVINKSLLEINKGSSDYGHIAEYALYVHNEESKIVNKDGYLFINSDGVNYLLGYTGTDSALILPSDYNGENYQIYLHAFYCNADITSVVIPDSVTLFGSSAFERCTALKNIKFRGTEGQWGEIIKNYHWNYNAGDYKISYNYNGH